jgi:hypothetical protein
VDQVCRTYTDWDLVAFLQLGVQMNKSKNDLRQDGEQLISTRQHIRAYTSAMASWIKAYIVRLREVAAAAAVPLQSAETVVDPPEDVDGANGECFS